jgi:hypothetical protein
VKITEKQEGCFKGVSPRRVKKVRKILGIGGGSKVKRLVVREEVVEDEVEVRGEERGRGRRAGKGMMEEREECVLESVEPVCVVVFEWDRCLFGGVAARKDREGAWHLGEEDESES